jgi:hypothetical protein
MVCSCVHLQHGHENVFGEGIKRAFIGHLSGGSDHIHIVSFATLIVKRRKSISDKKNLTGMLSIASKLPANCQQIDTGLARFGHQ